MIKEEIIEEIKRTARLNKGRVLGQERFQRETGIKISDWYPHLWLRWSDAVQEAGFVPNQLNTAISRDTIVEKLIGLIRELGHFPVVGERRIKAKQDPSFPSHGVFDKFGGKQKLIAAVMEYCQSHEGLDDVIEICLPHVSEEKHTENVSPNDGQENSDGFVYLMKSGRFYKIGRTDEIGRRHKEIRLQLPEELEVVHAIQTDDPSGIEAYWHKRFTDKRKNGEWFDLSRADINAFKRRKKFM